MKIKNMRTLLSLTVMSLIVVLNSPAQTLKLVSPPIPPTQPVPAQPMPIKPLPVIPAPALPNPAPPGLFQPTQPGQPLQPNQPGLIPPMHPVPITNRPVGFAFTNHPAIINNRPPMLTN